MKIFIVGFMGSGKTSCGKKISRKLNLKFYDLDEYVETNEEKTISEIFETFGESYFRRIEQKYLRQLFKKENIVVATGGGTPCYFSNMDEINENGISIYLKMSNKALFSRLADSAEKRPLLKNMDEQLLVEFIENTMDKRKKYYDKASIVIEALSININDLCEKLVI